MSELYIIVDQGMCTACGGCQATCPDVFAYNEKFIAYNRLDGNTGTAPIPEVVQHDALKLKFCPTKAIHFSDKPFVNFQQTPEFGDESPDNPNITYEIADDEWHIREV